MSELNKKELINCYKQMILIRRVEEKLMEVFAAGEIPGFIHVCIGQEATPVAVCNHLGPDDKMANTHRGHGHALAKGIDLKRFMAELFGRRNGPCRGRSGSMHLAEADIGILGANGIVAGGIPIANGAAFAAKYNKTSNVTVCFFGEGATDEGAFHEAINLAAVLRLPIVFVCENNQWAEFTPRAIHMSITDVASRAAAYGVDGQTVENEFFAIHEAAGQCIDRARKGLGPSLLEVKSLRWYGHFVGDAQKYRPPEDIESARAEDCVGSFENQLRKRRVLSTRQAEKIRSEIDHDVEEAVAFARQSPLPEENELADGLWL